MAFDPRLRSGIVETARSLGMNPVDLATIISYETGGTFDPGKRGPTTKWGQHRGLIQFGEPQARQYGVDWNDPIGSQLGADGAVARYFKASGYKPGMGLLDAYSTVNAGAPGLYNRSDAAAGGAPGTVRDKVENQMGSHRQKAEELIGSDPYAAMADGPKGEESFPPVSGGSGSDSLVGGTEGYARNASPFSIPQDVADYASGQQGPLGKIGSFLEKLGQAAPDTPRSGGGGGIGDARASGNDLAKVMASPTIADMLMQRRLRGLLG